MGADLLTHKAGRAGPCACAQQQHSDNSNPTLLSLSSNKKEASMDDGACARGRPLARLRRGGTKEYDGTPAPSCPVCR